MVFDRYRLGRQDVTFAQSGATSGYEGVQAEDWKATLGALDDLGNCNGVFDKPDHETGLEFVSDLPQFNAMLGRIDLNGYGSIDRSQWKSIMDAGAEDSGGTRAVISIISLNISHDLLDRLG